MEAQMSYPEAEFSADWRHTDFSTFSPEKGTVLTMHADGLTFWTDGLYKSTYHRVRAPREGDHRVRNLCFLTYHHDVSRQSLEDSIPMIKNVLHLEPLT